MANQAVEVESPQRKEERTAASTGLSGERQIQIALRKMIENGGQAEMQDIYQAVEAQMQGYVLSDQGRASLRYSVNKVAVEQGYVHPHDPENPGWRITDKGRRYIEQTQEEFPVTATLSASLDVVQARELEEGNDVNDVEEEDTLGDGDDRVAEPYDPAQINVISKDFTIFQIMRKIRLGEIKLQPDFQRLVVWDQARRSRLIESILIGIPLPSFYLDAVNPDKWLVVDGLQRLFTLNEFFNEKQLALTNLEFLRDLNGKNFDELPRNFQRDIEETDLSFYIIQPDTPPEVKFTIFSRVNTGGLVLKPQEIRHALFQGQATDLLQELARSPEFRRATTGSISPRRMDDRECVLRFLAFYLTDYRNYKKPDFNGFLSEVMESINGLSLQVMESLRGCFLAAMRKAEAVFGEYAFRKMYEIGGKRAPINKALFEVWSVSLLNYSLKRLVEHKGEIIAAFVEVMNNDKEFEKAISQGTGSRDKVEKRFETIENLLQRVVK